MEEEQKDQGRLARSRRNFYKILTIVLGSLVLLVIAGYATVEATSSSPFCGSCHNMKPEAETWKASSHAEVECKECHIQSGVVNYAKAKLNGLKQVVDYTTNNYEAPIEMKVGKEIPNATCEKCHNMDTRNVTTKDDIIIPHDKHLAKDIKCVTCHYDVVHGDISERKVTFKTDYDKWNDALGKQMMSDVKFTQPKMEDCIKCHEARDVSTECKTCHSTGMKPKSHDDPNFMKGEHGQLAEKDVKKCNSCHQYMSDTPIKDLKTKSASEQFLNTGKAKAATISAQDYAKDNTFCQKCHGKRPASHDSEWINSHGSPANTNKQECLTCHSDKQTPTTSKITSNGLVSNAIPTGPSGTAPACTSCHPAIHAGKDYKSGHPIDLTGVTKPSATCYTCHSKPTCTSCHKEDGVVTPKGTTSKGTSNTDEQQPTGIPDADEISIEMLNP